MSTDLISKARAKLQHHESEARRLRAFIEMAEAISSELEVGEGRAKPTSLPSASLPNKASGPSSTEVILRESESVLKDANGPLSTAEIYEKIIRRGVTVSGKNPKGNLSAKFSTRRHIFEYNKESGLWGLQAWTAPSKTV